MIRLPSTPVGFTDFDSSNMGGTVRNGHVVSINSLLAFEFYLWHFPYPRLLGLIFYHL